MPMFDAMNIADSGLTTHRKWLDAVADNIANINNVSRMDQPAFQERFIVARAAQYGEPQGAYVAGNMWGDPNGEVRLMPGHPLADAEGRVSCGRAQVRGLGVAAGVAQSFQVTVVLEQVLDLDRDVVGEVRESFVQRLDDAHGVGRTVEEVRIAKRDVLRASRDAAGRELPWGGAALARLATIDLSRRHPRLNQCVLEAACDVDNPLCGPTGASRVYGPQKGAGPTVVEELDAALRHFGDVIEEQLGVPVLDVPGAGAAGGLGAGLVAFAGGVLRPGVDIVADACKLTSRIAGAELVITGEGRIDAQTPHGKTPAGVAKAARQLGIPVVAIAGSLGPGYDAVHDCGIREVISIQSGTMSLAEAMAQGMLPDYESCRDYVTEAQRRVRG